MAFLPQALPYFGEITVRELVMLGRFPHQTWGMASSEDHEITNTLLEELQLTHLASCHVAKLSGGEQQRCRLAMAMAQQPEILLLDEPAAFLDPASQIRILQRIKSLNQQKNLTVIMVLHEVNLASSYADYLITLKDGRIRHTGTPSTVLTSDMLAEIYQLDAEILHRQGYPPAVLFQGITEQESPEI